MSDDPSNPGSESHFLKQFLSRWLWPTPFPPSAGVGPQEVQCLQHTTQPIASHSMPGAFEEIHKSFHENESVGSRPATGTAYAARSFLAGARHFRMGDLQYIDAHHVTVNPQPNVERIDGMH